MRIISPLTILTGTIATLCPLLLPLAGCEDPDARQRIEVQQALSDASAQYRQATVASVSLRDENVEEVRRELDAVISSLDGITGGEPSQQSAAAVLAADARIEVASINMHEAKLWETSLARQRSVLHYQLDGMKLLAARAKGREQFSADPFITHSHQLKDATDANVRELQRAIEEIESPIAELERLNEEDRRMVRDLREQTNELLRRAAELGHADGFDTVMEAAGARREADRLDRRSALRDLELNHDKRPQLFLFQHRMRSAQALIEAIDAALTDLEAFEAERTGDVSRLQNRIAERRSSIHNDVQEIAAWQSNELGPLYDEAIEHLQRAVNSTGRAAGQLRGDDAVFARLAEMRGYETLGELYWTRARGMADHARLLSSLVGAGEVVGRTDAYAAELEAAQSMANELLGSARESYQQAINSADQITGTAAGSVRPSRDRLEQFRAAIPEDFAEVSADPSKADQRVDPDEGFDSADALLAFLEQLDSSDMNAMRRLTGALHAQTSSGQAELNLMRTLLIAMFDLDDAMQETFGVGVDAAFGDMPGMNMADMNPFGPEGFSIIERTDSRVVIETEGPFGEADETELLEVNGRWFISMDPTDDEEVDEMGMEMIEQMFGAIAQAMKEFAGRVRAGEFDSPEQVAETLQQQMMQGMGAPGF